MKSWMCGTAVLAVALAAASRPEARRERGAQLIAHYPLVGDLNDATGNNAPLQARNAPLQPGKGIFCNGRYAREVASGCEVRTPILQGLNLSALTISAQFLVPRMWITGNPVFVAGDGWRWVFYELRPGGGVRLGYNNSQFADCSVTYRTGVWHEAAITFDGEKTTLYLDGVAGCSATGPLRTGNEKAIALTNFGNATTFYGMFRDLKIYNGVLVPQHRTPVPDDVPAPPEDLAPVDLFLARCPMRSQVASIDADLRLAFESDPTKDEPLACTAAGGSRDLSPMKKRVYNTLLLMKQLQFDQPLPWTKQPLYQWFIGTVKGIRFRADIANSSCCDPPRTLGIATPNLVIKYTDRWVEPAVHGGLDGFLLLLAHEARHAEGQPHTCGTKDRTPDEMGSWAVQYYLARWLAEHADQSFFTSGAIDYTERLRKEADVLLKQEFCS
jgi:hypothetical protein